MEHLHSRSILPDIALHERQKRNSYLSWSFGYFGYSPLASKPNPIWTRAEKVDARGFCSHTSSKSVNFTLGTQENSVRVRQAILDDPIRLEKLHPVTEENTFFAGTH